ncbi:MAG: metalloenzyme [Myxococcaceae bacterium]|nr:metalloenzyme [Myxococcaceae bacterium]
MRVALLFIDGVGIGSKSSADNPLTRGEFLVSRFDDGTGTALPAGGTWAAADTTFGLEGRPQSASNQTAIYTGLPAPKLIGEHLLGYPDPRLIALLDGHSIAKRIEAAGKKATFANAYPAAVLEHIGVPRRPSRGPDLELPPEVKRRIRASASALAMAAANVAMRTFDDARAGAGLTHDIDGALARARGMDVPARSPEEAAEIFWRLSADFTLFEHYLADEAGHARDMSAAVAALTTFDQFARAVIAQRPADAQVLICSDHGNVEDLTTRSHTRRPVPVLAFGPHDASRIKDVADVGLEVLRLVGVA